MAKTNNLPSVDDDVKPHERNGPAKAKPVPVAEPEAIPTEGYIPRNVDVRMTRSQATILRDKLRALQDAGAKTQDGRFITNRAQAVRWIIENEVDV